jgi:outer membrane protein assembly factor BamB
MVFKCKNCGAKLNVERGTEMITCEYCGSVNKVQTGFLQPDFYKNMSVKTKKYTKWSVFFTIGMVVFGIVMSLVANRGGIENITDEDSYYGTHKYNYHLDGGYLIDNNGDAYMDIVSIASNIEDSQYYLNILNGETGEKLYSVKIVKEKSPKLFVIDQKYICVSKEDFTLSIYDTKELKELKTVSLSDKVEFYEMKDNVLHIEAYDDTKWTLDMNSFAFKQDNFNFRPEFRPARYVHDNTVEQDGIIYSAEKKEKSSKDVFSVKAEKNGQIVWNLPLGFEDMTWWDGPVIVVADQNIVTFGKKFSSDNLGYVIGIDKTEGRIKYEVQKSGGGCRIYDMYLNGRYVITNINGSFHAIDPGNGETKWTAGNYCEW